MKDEPSKNPPVVPQVVGKRLKDIQDEEPIQSFIEAISPKNRSKSHISSSSKPTQSIVIETPSTQKSIQISKKEKISKQKSKCEVGVSSPSKTKKFEISSTSKLPTAPGDSIHIIDVEEEKIETISSSQYQKIARSAYETHLRKIEVKCYCNANV